MAELAPAALRWCRPAPTMLGACGFALRLRRAIEHIVMTYREERIRRLTMGIAARSPTVAADRQPPIGIGRQRLAPGGGGGNRVVGEGGEVTPNDRTAGRPPVSIDQIDCCTWPPSRRRMRRWRSTSDAIRTLLPRWN